MGLEAATFVSQLTSSNPLAGDKKNQGDDHLRLIKSVLQATFPNADRAYRLPEVVTKTGAYVMAESDDNKTILCDAGGGQFNVTLPTPSFDGWMVHVIKTDGTTSPVFVLPPSGTINGFAKIRLNVPFVKQTFLWTGSTFIRLQDPGQLRAGSFEIHGGTSAPVGYQFATGQFLAQSEHPELFAAWGGTWGSGGGLFNAPDFRDRFVVGSGSTYGVGSTGGQATVALGIGEIPTHSHGVSQNNHDHGITVPLSKTVSFSGFSGVGGQAWFGDPGVAGTTNGNVADITIQNAGGGGAHENRPPYLGVPYMFRLC